MQIPRCKLLFFIAQVVPELSAKKQKFQNQLDVYFCYSLYFLFYFTDLSPCLSSNRKRFIIKNHGRKFEHVDWLIVLSTSTNGSGEQLSRIYRVQQHCFDSSFLLGRGFCQLFHSHGRIPWQCWVISNFIRKR